MLSGEGKAWSGTGDVWGPALPAQPTAAPSARRIRHLTLFSDYRAG